MSKDDMITEEIMTEIEALRDEEEIGVTISTLDNLISMLNGKGLTRDADTLSHAMKTIWNRSRDRLIVKVSDTLEKSGVSLDEDDKEFLQHALHLTPKQVQEAKRQIKELTDNSVEPPAIKEYHLPS